MKFFFNCNFKLSAFNIICLQTITVYVNLTNSSVFFFYYYYLYFLIFAVVYSIIFEKYVSIIFVSIWCVKISSFLNIFIIKTSSCPRFFFRLATVSAYKGIDKIHLLNELYHYKAFLRVDRVQNICVFNSRLRTARIRFVAKPYQAAIVCRYNRQKNDYSKLTGSYVIYVIDFNLCTYMVPKISYLHKRFCMTLNTMVPRKYVIVY